MKLLLMASGGGTVGWRRRICALDLLPANTKAVFGMRVPGIVESALFQGCRARARRR